MKTKFSRILGVGLSFMLVASFMVFAVPVSADTLNWGEEDLPTVEPAFSWGKTVQPLTDILGFSAANDEKTIYAVVQAEVGHPNEDASEVWRSTNAGQTWWDKSPKTPAGNVVTHVAVSPDDPAVVVAAGLDEADGDNTVWISVEKGELGTWSASDISTMVDGDITCLAISVERDDKRWVAVGDASGNLVVAEATAFAAFEQVTAWPSWGLGSENYTVNYTNSASANESVILTITTGAATSWDTTPVNVVDITAVVATNGNTAGFSIAGSGGVEDIAHGTKAASAAFVDAWEGEAVTVTVTDNASASENYTISYTNSAADNVTVQLLITDGAATWSTDPANVVDITAVAAASGSGNTAGFSIAGSGGVVDIAHGTKAAAGTWSDDWTGEAVTVTVITNPSGAVSSVLAVGFSPWFGNDDTVLAVTTDGTDTHLMMGDVGDEDWNTASGYPVTIVTDGAATAASISLPDEYYGIDPAERIAYIGTTVGTSGAVYRLDDTIVESIKTGNLPWVAYNSEENKLLVGYGNTGRVDMSDNPDSGSPSFTRPASMKSPSGEGVSAVAWLGLTMMCSTTDISDGAVAPLDAPTADDESAISVSTDARAWNQLSLIDTDLDNITDFAVSGDGTKIYVASQNSEGSFYSVWRYASRWERVLCDEAEGATNVPIIRIAPEKPEVVFVALTGTKEIRRSTDSGETWKQSRSDIDVKDMAAKDDKVVFTVDSMGQVSTSKDGGRTFADYVKSNVKARHMIVAANGDVLIVGEYLLKTPNRISVIRSTDDGATWKIMRLNTGLDEVTANSMVVAADTDYATNDYVYIGHTDDDAANILRWKVGGDLEVWEDIASWYYTLTEDDVISGLACHGGVLYVSYYNTTDNTSGFLSTTVPAIKKTDVWWGGGSGTAAEESDTKFSLRPQALKLSSGSVKLWAINANVVPDKGNELYSYTDILGKVEAPTLTAPADKYVATVDPVLQKVNAVRFTWEEVDPMVTNELRIGTNAAVTKNYLTFTVPAKREWVSIEYGVDGAAAFQYPFVSGETYYWRVRAGTPTSGPWSEIRSFTVEKLEVVVAAPPEVTVKPPEVTVAAPPAPEVTVTVEPAPPAPAPIIPPAIPMWTLWTIIVIGAVLVIAVIVLIVRTRRVV